MGKPVIFETPSGDQMVVLPLDEYEALVAGVDPESAADVAAFDAAMADLASGEDRKLSPEEMMTFYARPGFLRGLRKGRRMTQAAFAGMIGITQGFLSDLEAGRRKASPETLQRMAEALHIEPLIRPTS